MAHIRKRVRGKKISYVVVWELDAFPESHNGAKHPRGSATFQTYAEAKAKLAAIERETPKTTALFSGLCEAFLRHFQKLGGVGQLVVELADRSDRGLKLLALAHQLLRGGGIVPDGGVFSPGVQLVQAAAGGIPVKDASSAGRWPAGYRLRRGQFRGAWRAA